ncbi:MAG: 16S rRNA (adenine(1518)-N(6)/adenine(1519)-N(6))-dimethyltransferase RsmA [Cytophagaceae bacterium]|nr:16S rRNA (adenine(1518)-N(6)/adenine(1519)-N(6))-dimethyltransferase RsmA [Cytophagaceae bacterium]
MNKVRPKKNLGQHFLNDSNIAHDIVKALPEEGIEGVLEIGPGMGVLTQFLIPVFDKKLWVIELDKESVSYLNIHYHGLHGRILNEDFLRWDPARTFEKKRFAIIGNFPYNISSQIFFKALDHRDQVPLLVGMLQKEVAERLCSGPGNRDYGILSVLLQAWYDMEYLFTVPAHVFTPPPKVTSAVIRMKRNNRQDLGVDEKLFKRIVKQCFSMRRKTLRNNLKSMALPEDFLLDAYFNKRAEELSVEEYLELTKKIAAVL